MTILKEGNKDWNKNPKWFCCERCKCEFVALESEYKRNFTVKNEELFSVECPTCGKTVYWNPRDIFRVEECL